MLYDVPSRGFKLSQLLNFDLSGAAEISLHQDTLKVMRITLLQLLNLLLSLSETSCFDCINKVEELFGKDPLRQVSKVFLKP